ncbi:unnamed protein product [Caenorhabditis bovis]|uniref:Uncharacterized protein n=1 Tax=Caenorhabditis bovis TaxID=2654633 RepID=A0A8S1F4F6_9PELO|nr:unnamed protein product [Caenorhabditis bovis]
MHDLSNFDLSFSNFDLRLTLLESQITLTIETAPLTRLQPYSMVGLNPRKVERVVVKGGYASNIEHIQKDCNPLRRTSASFYHLIRLTVFADPGSEQYRTSVFLHPLRMPYRTLSPTPLHFVKGSYVEILTLYICGDYRTATNPWINVRFYNSRISMSQPLGSTTFRNGTVQISYKNETTERKPVKSKSIFTYKLNQAITENPKDLYEVNVWELAGEDDSVIVDYKTQLELDYKNVYDFAVVESNVQIYYVRWMSSRNGFKHTCGYRASSIDQMDNKVPLSNCQRLFSVICERRPEEVTSILTMTNDTDIVQNATETDQTRRDVFVLTKHQYITICGVSMFAPILIIAAVLTMPIL